MYSALYQEEVEGGSDYPLLPKSEEIVSADMKSIFQVSLRLRREARKTSECLASASSVIEVRDHHH